MKKLLLSTALVALAAPALALNVTLSETESVVQSIGGESTSNNLISPISVPFGSFTSAVTAFSVTPAGACSGGGAGCNSATKYEQETITWSLTALTDNALSVLSQPITETGLFEAQYATYPARGELACAVGNGDPGSTASQSDCFVWTGAPNAWDGSVTKGYALGGALAGDTLEVTFYNASDWTVTPTVSFELKSAAATPEPSTWALGLMGFAALGLAGFRRRRAAATA